jgi:fructosamine-3-kinase
MSARGRVEAIARAVAHVTRASVQSVEPLGGGDIALSARVEVAGRRCFAKLQALAPRGALACEAAGLEWLREAAALRIPEVLAVGEARDHQVLVLEWIESGAPAADHDEQLGRGLAALHGAGAPRFGLDRDNFIGTLPQVNGPGPNAGWSDFYAHRRLEPLIAPARGAGLLGADRARRLARLLERLPEITGPPEPPARLHGDLWAGNALCDERGRPVLIDPAVYGGHREMDLAMMALFGGFSSRVLDAYREASPLAPGWRERVPLYQLYPLLVHVNLFGAGYLGALDQALQRCP